MVPSKVSVKSALQEFAISQFFPSLVTVRSYTSERFSLMPASVQRRFSNRNSQRPKHVCLESSRKHYMTNFYVLAASVKEYFYHKKWNDWPMLVLCRLVWLSANDECLSPKLSSATRYMSANIEDTGSQDDGASNVFYTVPLGFRRHS